MMSSNIIKLIRPWQWLKNVFVFIPMFFGGSLLDPSDIRASVLTFMAYSLIASSVYCFNDINDVEADRRHPVKCRRPLASGALPLASAWVVMALMLVLAAAVVTMLGDMQRAFRVGGVLLFYYVMNLCYCARLKQYAIVDVCVVAFGFVLRVLAGGYATDIVPSKWLVLMTFLWMFVTANVGFRSDVGDNSMLAVAVSMYIAALSLLSFSIGTMDIRIEHAGVTFRLFDGLIGTAKRMAVPALLALLILLYAADPGWNAVSLIAISAVFCVVLMFLALTVRLMSDEATFVEDVSRGWSSGHPVDFYAGFDGRDGRHPLNDGVPGTPVRPAESCFDPRRKN